jgi:hypothetical protein
VLRTLYMPNEKIDSLLLSIESLRAQLQEQVGEKNRFSDHAKNRPVSRVDLPVSPWSRSAYNSNSR